MTRAKPKSLILKPVRPNAGIRAKYRKRVVDLVDEMAASYEFWLKRAYTRTPPKIAQDDIFGKWGRKLASRVLEKELADLGKRWQEKFDDMAERLSGWFTKAVDDRTQGALKHIMRKAGWTVRLNVTPALRDVIQATTVENVGLIKSIPEQFHTQVQGAVMRSVTAGRDLAPLVKELRERHGVTRRRAEFIALDQNNKATAAIMRAKHLDLGITEAIWMHSAGGKKKRPTHVANNGKRYDVAKGWFDPAVKKFIQPGELPRCRCVSGAVVKGFS